MSISKRIADRQRRNRQQIEISEWGEDDSVPLVIYYGPLLALEMDKIQRKHPKFFESANIAGMVDLIIMKAENSDGEKLFTLEDKSVLMREEFTLVTKIAGAMIASSSVEEHEKN